MTRKNFPLMILAGALLISCTFSGCGPKKQDRVSSLQLQNENLKGQLQGSQRRQDELLEDKQSLSMDLDEARRELDAKQAQINQLQGQVAAGAGTSSSAGIREVMGISGSLSFRTGSATLTSAGKRELGSIVSRIRSRYGGRHISVEGHTDRSPLVKTKPKWGNNIWLSANRAKAVADYLIGRGTSENLVSVVGHGASRSKGGSPAQDRRVEIIVLAQ